jgi:SAM-dependent methyltransferase
MWDERFSEAGFAYGTEPNDFLLENYEKLPLGNVLCLAEGEGRNAVFLAENGYHVTAVDQSEVGLIKAENLATKRGVVIKTIHADLSEFEIENGAWSAIVSLWAHLPPNLRRDVHARVVNGLQPGGAFLLEAYTPKQVEFGTGGPNRDHIDRTMTLAALREELNGLSFEIAQEIERDIREGKYHNGQSAVVQILAFKTR